jgi:hypothetical protein
LLKAIRTLPERDQDAVLAYLLERTLVDPAGVEAQARVAGTSPGIRPALGARMELLSIAQWATREAVLLLGRLAAGKTVEQIAALHGLDPDLLRSALQDLATRSHRSDRLAPIFQQLAEGRSIEDAARQLKLSRQEIVAELQPTDEMTDTLRGALMARAALVGPPAGYLGTVAQGPLRTIPVRLPEQQYQRLKNWAEQNTFPMAVIVRGVIERFLDEQQQRGT